MVFVRAFRVAVVCALAVLLFNCKVSASTGRSREITNIHFENVTQTTVDVVWNTAHPSTSQVLIARDTNYEPERWAPATADAALVTTHHVTVDHLLPYNQLGGDGQYYIYVASVDSHGEMSTAPGPQTGDGKNPLLSMRTLPTDASGARNFKLYTLGPNEVFAGSDMYFLVHPVLISGPVGHLYIYNQHGYNNGSDGVVKYEGANADQGNVDTISVHFSCVWNNPTGLDSNEQSLNRLRNLGFCHNGNNDVNHSLTFRLRTQANTTPGKYSVTFTLETNGQQQAATYEFTVLPSPKAPLRPAVNDHEDSRFLNVGEADGGAWATNGVPIAINRTQQATLWWAGDGLAMRGSTTEGGYSRASIPIPPQRDMPITHIGSTVH